MLDSKKVFLGIAPIGWTNDDMPELGAENTFQQCVSEMALAGFSGTEIGNKYPPTRRRSSICWTCAASESRPAGSVRS